MSELALELYVSNIKTQYAGKSGIYALRDPESGNRVYVGKAACISTRYKGHVSAENEYSAKSLWIKDTISKGLFPILEVLEICDESLLSSKEKHWIKKVFGNGEKTVNSKNIKKNTIFGGSQKHSIIMSQDTSILAHTISLMCDENLSRLFERLIWKDFWDNHDDAAESVKKVFDKRGLDFEAIVDARKPQ